MNVTDMFGNVIGRVRADTELLVDRLRMQAEDRLAQLAGNVAGLADEAGETAARTANRAGEHAAVFAEGAATLTGDMMRRACELAGGKASEWSERLGTGVLGFSERFTDPDTAHQDTAGRDTAGRDSGTTS